MGERRGCCWWGKEEDQEEFNEEGANVIMDLESYANYIFTNKELDEIPPW